MSPFTFATTSISSLLLTLITGLGVVIHDTQTDRALVRALTPPTEGYIAPSDASLRTDNQHTHTETIADNLRNATAAQSRLQTRVTDKKYITPKKIYMSTTFDT